MTVPTIEPLDARQPVPEWVATLCAAAEAGVFVPPAAMIAAVRANNAIAQASRAPFPERSQARSPSGRGLMPSWRRDEVQTVGLELGRDLLTGKPVDLDALGAPIIALEDAERRRRARDEVLDKMAETVHGSWPAILSDGAMIGALAAAWADIRADVRKLPEDLPATLDAAVDAGAGQVAAFRAMQRLVARHTALRAAQAAVRYVHHSVDTLGLFAESPEYPPETHRPTFGATYTPAGPPSTDPVARLRWLAGPGRGWVPTIAEQDRVADTWIREVSADRPAGGRPAMPAVARR